MDKTSSASKAESSSAGRGNREDKAGSASGHEGKDDTKAPQPSNVTGKEPSSTSGQPPVKGKGKGKGKDGQPSSTEEDTLPSIIMDIWKEAKKEADVEEITVEFLDSQIEHISQQIQLIQDRQNPDANLNSLVEKINKSFSERMTLPKSGWIAKVWSHKRPDVGQIRTMAIDIIRTMAIDISETLANLQPWYFAGLLIVAHVLRRFKDIKDHRDECFEVIKEINVLAKFVISLKSKYPRSNKGMARMIKESRQLILHGSILCCTILESSFMSKFFNASANKDQLAKLKGEVVRAYNQLKGELSSETLKLSSETLKDVKYLADRERVRWPQDMQDMMQDHYPDHAVGIDVQLNKVIELLEWESEAKTVAVVVHGIPGMGKTTLADAVFSTIFQQNYTSTNICEYSKIKLCEDNESSPTITTLQKTIRDDLDNQRAEGIRSFDDGQRKIGNILKKKSVFLYIDNVLNPERLDQLLPLRSTLDKARKLRLLITARDKSIGNVLGHHTCKYHEMQRLSSSEAKKLLTKHMDTQNKSVMEDILDTAQGVPLILTVIGQFFGAQDDKEKAYSIFKEERKNWRGQIFDRLDRLDINMAEDLKDTFLDICSIFNGWHWQPLADIVGISTLDTLENKAFLTKRNSRVTVNEVFLRIGLQKSKGTRIMDANEISQLDMKGIKGLCFTTDQGRKPIPAKKLDQAARSLRFLALQNFKVEGDYTKNFPELIYLDAGVNPLPSKVSAFEKLTYLSYSPQNPEDLNLSQMPSTMKRLKLNGRSYSDNFRSCPLRLHGLQDLTVLKLFEFKNLTKLPQGFASLKCLRELHIIDCDGFEELPTDLGDLNQMSTLVISKCPKLLKLPESISKLSSLRKLSLSSCKKLEDLSKDFHSLPSLQNLTLISCPMLQGECMDMIKEVKTLKVVDIRKSQKLLQKWQGLTDPPTTFSVKMK